MITYRGTPVSEGVATGELYLPDAIPAEAGGAETRTGSVTVGDVRGAFAAVAAERHALAGRLRAAGRDHEADIVTIGALMAADPALSGPATGTLGAATAADQAEHGTVRPDHRRQIGRAHV